MNLYLKLSSSFLPLEVRRSKKNSPPAGLMGSTFKGLLQLCTTLLFCYISWHIHLGLNSSKDEGCIFLTPHSSYFLPYFPPLQHTPLPCSLTVLLSSLTAAGCIWSHQSPQRPPGELVPLFCPPVGTLCIFYIFSSTAMNLQLCMSAWKNE